MLYYVQTLKLGNLISAKILTGCKERDAYIRSFGTSAERRQKGIGFITVSGNTKEEIIDVCKFYDKDFIEF